MQKAIPGQGEEEADGEKKGQTKGRAQGVQARGEALTLHGADFFISTTWHHARAFHNFRSSSRSPPPLSPLPLVSLQTVKEQT